MKKTDIVFIYKARYTNQSLMAIQNTTSYSNNQKTISWYTNNSISDYTLDALTSMQGNYKLLTYYYFALI